MSAIAIQIADAVVAEINGHTFSQPFTAQRFYRPEFDRKEMATLHVSVLPSETTMASLGRNQVQQDYSVEIGVQKKAVEIADLDALMTLVEEIGDFFKCRRLAQYPSAIWLRMDNVPIYRPDHLETLKQFTSVLKITFRVVR